MSTLEKLLAPYRQALAGTPSTPESFANDPIYQLLLPTPPATPKERAAQQPGTASSIIGLAKRLERMGFDVGELEGFQGEGQISSGHVANSQHYTGDAFDVNYRGGGRWGSETKALNWLNRYLARTYNPSELLWQTANHYDHLHAGFR